MKQKVGFSLGRIGTLAGNTFKIRFSGNSSVENNIANKNIFFRNKCRFMRWANNKPPARYPLPDVIISVPC